MGLGVNIAPESKIEKFDLGEKSEISDLDANLTTRPECNSVSNYTFNSSERSIKANLSTNNFSEVLSQSKRTLSEIGDLSENLGEIGDTLPGVDDDIFDDEMEFSENYEGIMQKFKNRC